MKHIWRALLAIIERDLKRMFRQRGRLISAMVRPLIWLLIIGSGFQTLADQGNSNGNYKQFLVPGLLCMVLLFGSLLASLSMVYDKESGVMRMLVMAPFAHYWIILTRTLSATLVGLTHVGLLMIILSVMGYLPYPHSLLWFIVGIFLTSLLCAAMGMLIAVHSKSFEDFAVIMNFVIFPTFFLSGALYPLQNLPVVLKIVALLNPFSYGVDMVKHSLLPELSQRYSTDFSSVFDLLIILLFIICALTYSCVRFSNASVMETIARVLSSPRRH